MAKNHTSELSTTAASNTEVAGVTVVGTDSVNKIDNMIRAALAVQKQTYEDLGGLGAVGGTADAITVTGTLAPASLIDGQIFLFFPSADNTGAATLDWNSLGAKSIRKISSGADIDIEAGDLLEVSPSSVIYDPVANSSNGAWILQNPQTAFDAEFADGTAALPSITFASDPDTGFFRVAANQLGVTAAGSQVAEFSSTGFELLSEDAGATVGPKLDLYRDSASPAIGDDIGSLVLSGENSSGAKVDYVTIQGKIADETSGTEDGRLQIKGLVNGSQVALLDIIGSTDETYLRGTVRPSGSGTLGASGAGWDDLYLNAGGKIVWDSGAAEMYQPDGFVKQAFERLSSTDNFTGTSFADVSGLGISVNSGETWHFEGVLFYDTTVTNQITLGFNGPSASSLRVRNLVLRTGNDSIGSYDTASYNSDVGFANTGTDDDGTFNVAINVTFSAGGTFVPRARRSSGGGTVSILNTSYLKGTRIS